ncbi:hypothetical protein LTR10_021203 [Elasticomyces elasticus]|uniref:D-xylulose reductase n=1 Tax=Exophiala sideris TaxID=1016849 RepID=A0ABR0IY00_9EURO|nr:hypothetical protein LTR10_021203 [Elasticomyces elasticus]KAK5022329.1 hypothetical protein LTS07_010205 [Exophiala sideris]KAK5027141.1 hypothetical protein LTR13_009751 [Exophiala sideris]KAK5051716.1 hypothetical protein LTR69_010216 [Exophiala sideris]KAK5177681.1 hypothetical protein LTR44_009871 [Eurotiomycetes sp. CCFEE 6388]
MSSTETVQALVLHGAKDLRLETRPQPAPGPSEVQIAVKATGLCGSDLHYYNEGRNGNFVLQSPLVLGHEASGVVTAVPDASNGATKAVTPSADLKVGDRVAMETIISQPANMCHKLPENVTFEQGALVEPLAVSLHALNRSQTAGSGAGVPLTGSSALVLGAGAVGMLTAAALAVAGVTSIVIADIDAPRLKIAAGLGGGRYKLKTFLLPRKAPAPTIEETLSGAKDLAAEVSKSAGLEAGFDRVYECTGVPSCVQMGIFATTAGGKLVLVGMGNPTQTLPLGAAALREVDIIGVFRYANCYPAAIALFASGKLDGVAEDLVTHRVALADGEKAFRLAANRAREGEDEGRVPVKVVITS